MGIKMVLVFLILLFSLNTYAQQIHYPKFSATFNNTSLREALETISDQTGISIHFRIDWVEKTNVNTQFNNTPLENVIGRLLEETGLFWLAYDETNIVILDQKIVINYIDETPDHDPRLDEPAIPVTRADAKVILKGHIRDGNNEDPIGGATIYIEEIQEGVATREDGSYSIEIEPGLYHLIVRSVNYAEEVREIELHSSRELDFDLFESVIRLDEVFVTQERVDDNFKSVQIGLERVGLKELRIIPQFMGEKDFIKGLMILPGVSTVGEGASGYNVRGGTVGQNLILQDEALIFNSAHLFGFFSAFNSDVVQEVTLHKGNPPASEGGRISSILDVRLKNGSRDRIHFTGGIGTVSSKLAVDGPFAKGQGNYLLAGRGSYVNWMLKQVDNLEVNQSRANFYDLNARFNINMSEDDALTFSVYNSYDNFKFATDTVITWITKNVSGIWNHVIKPELLSRFSLVYGQYDTNIRDINGINTFDFDSYIHHLKSKFHFTYLAGEHNVDFGVSGIYYSLSPGNLEPGAGSFNIQPVEVQNEYSLESSAFINDNFRINSNLSLNAGLRLSYFLALGPKTVYAYEKSVPKDETTILDTLVYNDFDVIKTYSGLEPRISLRYLLSPSSSLKVGYARNRQYIHFISNTAVISPQDYWVNSGFYIPPEIGDQFSIGYFKNFANNNIEFSTEGFYKRLKGVIDYKEGASILLNEALEKDLVSGIGRAYGVEVMLNKLKGRLSGRISYTYSRSERKFDSQFRSEQISLGEYYPSYYDKPHDLTVLFNYQLSRGIKFSANFTYASGRPVTAPVSKYSQEQILSILNFSKRNQFRIPDYHRLDISFILGLGARKDRKYNDEIVFSIYNLYGRRNAYSVYFNQAGWAYRLSILGTAFPSIAYNFKF